MKEQKTKKLLKPIENRIAEKLKIKEELADHLQNYPNDKKKIPGMQRKADF